MIALNLLVALAYVANAVYFATRFPLPRGKERWALAAQICAGVFFVTCAATHIGIALAVYHSNSKVWLFSWWMLADHALQAPAGLMFVAIAWRKLNLTLMGDTDVQRRNLESFRAALMDNAVSAIITTNSDGRVLDWNKAAETIFLYSHAEVIGQSLMDLIGLGEIEGIQECRLQTATGNLITTEVGTRRFQTTEGIVVVAFVRDISARVEAERGRRRALGRLLHAEQESRAQIAEELHDDTIQVMAATLMKLDVCEMRMKELGASSNGDAKQFEDYQALLESAVSTLRQAMSRTRRMMFELRPPELTDAGLDVAILSLAREIDREVHTLTTVEIEIGRQPEEIEKLVYRVILEALTNIRKHAHATQVAIHLSYADGSLHGSVEDDGTGFNVVSAMDKTDRHLHLGIGSCQERVKLAGGSYFVISNPDQGTTVNFEIPTSHDGLSWQTLYDVIA